MRPILSVKEVQNKCRLLRSNRSSKEAHFKCALTVHLPPTWVGSKIGQGQKSVKRYVSGLLIAFQKECRDTGLDKKV